MPDALRGSPSLLHLKTQLGLGGYVLCRYIGFTVQADAAKVKNSLKRNSSQNRIGVFPYDTCLLEVTMQSSFYSRVLKFLHIKNVANGSFICKNDLKLCSLVIFRNY